VASLGNVGKALKTDRLAALQKSTVQRAGVTTALGHFESNGVIETTRGAVTEKDRDGLDVPTG
jgi:hypothetical protein